MKIIENMYTISALAWKPDGSRLTIVCILLLLLLLFLLLLLYKKYHENIKNLFIQKKKIKIK